MCEERLRLLEAYDRAVEAFAANTSDLKVFVTNGSKVEFDQLYKQTIQALADARAAKAGLVGTSAGAQVLEGLRDELPRSKYAP